MDIEAQDDRVAVAASLQVPVLAAPVTEAGARRRRVYLPAGARWSDAWSGHVHEGGSLIEQEAPLHEIPVYLRDGATVPVAG